MSDAHIQGKIKEYLANRRRNGCSQLPYRIGELTSDFPILPIHQIRAFCKAQEQMIIEKVIPMNPQQLYDQIARICPQESDIKTISVDEVAVRVSLYNAKLVLHEKMTCESESQDSWEESKGGEFFGEVEFDEECLLHHENENENHTMRNIFEECDNQNHNWNASEYFA